MALDGGHIAALAALDLDGRHVAALVHDQAGTCEIVNMDNF